METSTSFWKPQPDVKTHDLQPLLSYNLPSECCLKMVHELGRGSRVLMLFRRKLWGSRNVLRTLNIHLTLHQYVGHPVFLTANVKATTRPVHSSSPFLSVKCLRRPSGYVTSWAKRTTCPRRRSSPRWTLCSEKETSWSGRSLPGGGRSHRHSTVTVCSYIPAARVFVQLITSISFLLCSPLDTSDWYKCRFKKKKKKLKCK